MISDQDLSQWAPLGAYWKRFQNAVIMDIWNLFSSLQLESNLGWLFFWGEGSVDSSWYLDGKLDLPFVVETVLQIDRNVIPSPAHNGREVKEELEIK